MSFRKIVLVLTVSAGSLYGSIVTAFNPGTGSQGAIPGTMNTQYTNGGFVSPTWEQDFGTDALQTLYTLPAAQGSLGTNVTGFDYLDLISNVSNNNLIYDPNGSPAGSFAPGGCDTGKTSNGASLTGFVNCVGNYVLASTSSTQASLPSSPLTSFSILFDAPVTEAAFELTVYGQMHNNTNIQVYDVNGNLIDQAYVEQTTIGGDSWVYITGESANISTVTISSTGYNEANGSTWNFVLGDVEAAPEPGTLMLLGTGLFGVAYFARRSKLY